MKKFLFLILSFVVYYTSGQQALGEIKLSNVTLFEYFQAQQYHDVIKLISNKNSLTPDEKIIYGLSKLKAGEDTSDEIESWIKEYKNHPLQSLARFKYAEHAFFNGDTIVSRNLLKSIRPNELSVEDQASYGFVYGTLKLQSKEYRNAASLFKHAEKNDFADKQQLTYYQAFTSYHLNDLEPALEGFSEVQESKEYGLSSKFFIAKIQLEYDKYDEVIRLSQFEISDEKSITNSGFHQLIGEAHARKGNEAKADAYFEQAINMHPDRPSSALYYQAGVSKFRIGNVDKALAFLKEAGIGSGPYAQLSAFQLGRLYVKRNEFKNALPAYIEASASDDPAIKEESLYHSAKLNAQLERFTDAINYSDDYLNRFPNGKWKGEIQDLIAQSYLKTSNYDLAISHLEEIGVSNEIQKEVFQKVTFQKAILLYNDGEFANAQTNFQKSLLHPKALTIANDAHFYIGEILLRNESYTQAIISYQKQTPISTQSQYGIGYAYFNQQEYEKAIAPFEKALQNDQEEIRLDAKLRLADCFYATKSYEQALRNYQSIPNNDYTTYQSGMVLKSLGRESEAREYLSKISSNSNLRDNAEFNMAQIAFEGAEFAEAEKGFTDLINSFPSSNYLPKAYLNRAIARNNLQQYEMAKDDYEYVIENFIQKEEAFNAILGLQELQQQGERVGNLDKHIADYKKANPDDSSLEVVEFEASKSAYFELNYEFAITKLTNFLKEYSQSKFKAEAEYYLGDSYYRTEKLAESKSVFDKQKFVRNVFTGRILTRLGDINSSLALYEEAIEAYRLLKDLNLTPKDTYNAINGLMNAHFTLNRFTEAISNANEILELAWKPLNASQIASFIKAKSLEELEDHDNAIEEYSKLSEGSDAIAAESQYRIANIQFNHSAYDKSLDLLFDLNS
ncbi:MAG: tetratricopeptide repeat protein, partial [Bacteroidota bacterium]